MAPPTTTNTTAARMLREKADSYFRDAETFAASSDIQDNDRWAIVYRAISRELSQVAEQVAKLEREVVA